MKAYLQQIRKIDTQLVNKNYEVQRLGEFGLSAAGVLGEMALLEEERAKIIKAIEQLPEAEYAILHLVYVQHKNLQEAAAVRDISYSLAATIHGRALKRLEGIVNGSKSL